MCRELVRSAHGLEIGGPSPIFARGGLIPIYPSARQIDNVNFARTTTWERAITEGDTYRFHPGSVVGRQFIAEGADLRSVPTESYDFILSSHMLEHTANPLRALKQWAERLRVGGGLILVLPHRDGTFDHRRPVTSLQHLEADFENETAEGDLTHLQEVLELHDISRDAGISDAEALRTRALQNADIRSMHHHVFDTRLAVATLCRAGFEVVAVEPLEPYHIIVIAKKPAAGTIAEPVAKDLLRATLFNSPFVTDRQNL